MLASRPWDPKRLLCNICLEGPASRRWFYSQSNRYPQLPYK